LLPIGPGVGGHCIPADPHYLLTVSAQSTSPPPPLAATVIQNHPAWLANDALSSWVGPVNPGTANVAAGEYRYRVASTKIVKPRDVSVLDSSESEILTLVTCYPFSYVGPAPQRFIVRAELI